MELGRRRSQPRPQGRQAGIRGAVPAVNAMRRAAPPRLAAAVRRRYVSNTSSSGATRQAHKDLAVRLPEVRAARAQPCFSSSTTCARVARKPAQAFRTLPGCWFQLLLHAAFACFCSHLGIRRPA